MFKYLVILGLCCASIAHAAINVSSAQLTTSKKMTRLVLESSQPIAHSSFNLANPERLVIDLNGVSISPTLEHLHQKVTARDAVIQSLHLTHEQKKSARLTLTLKHPVTPQVLAVGPLKHKVYRLTFDFYPSNDKPNTQTPVTRPAKQITSTDTVKTAQISPPKPVANVAPLPVRPLDDTLVIQPRNTPLGIPITARDEPLVIHTAAHSGVVQPPRPSSVAPVPRTELLVIKPTRTELAQATSPPPQGNTKITFQSAPPAETRPPVLTASNHLRPNMTFYNETSPQPPKLKMSELMETPAPKPRRLRGRSPMLRAAQQLQTTPESLAPPAPLARPDDFAMAETLPFGTSEITTNVAPNGQGMFIVALDAGHGGEDPGALGYYGSFEKTVTLAITRQVQSLLAQTPNLRGVLTRTGDFYIPLAERVNKAHQANADLFVSIHADAFINTTAHGSSVYTLSKHGASSTAANWLANKENSADLIGGTNVVSKDPFLMRTLFDLSQTAAVKDSRKLATHVLKELGGINNLHRGKVEQAGFAVLKSPKIPSILIETAFISNPEEESRLNDLGYQTQIARAIVRGIQRYFTQNTTITRDKLARNE